MATGEIMIHYHGTPIGGSRQDTARFLIGRHALIPFGRQDDVGPVLEFCQSFVLDNGAFTHWKQGKGEIDFAAYQRWANSLCRHPGFDWCLIPDIIDGTEDDNVNWVMLWVRSGSKAKGVPVWHMHESFEWLEYLVENFETVALGSSGAYKSPGTSKWWARMGEAMRVICDEQGRPKCRLHGLRMLDPEIFTRLPLASADSTNAAVNSGSLSRFGIYTPPTSSQRAAVIADRIESNNSAAVWHGNYEQLELAV
jgi:hypothetical protein